MAIQRAHTDPKTGEVSTAAHTIVANPVMNPATKQVRLTVTTYASKAAYDAGREPVAVNVRTFPRARYDALRTLLLNQIEPLLIAGFFPDGTRVAD